MCSCVGFFRGFNDYPFRYIKASIKHLTRLVRSAVKLAERKVIKTFPSVTGVIEISFSVLLLSSSYTRILLINDALSLLPPSHSLLFISIVVLDVAASLEVASQSVRHRPNDEVAASQKNSSYFTSIASYLPHSLTSASCFSWTFCLT